MPQNYLPTEINTTNVDGYFKEIEAIYKVLVSERDLSPCEKINGLFSRLVHMTHPACFRVDRENIPVGFEDLARRLQALCSAGEYQLELYWSRRIVGAPDPLAELYQFPYIKNYKELTRLEYINLSACCRMPPRRILFVGSGPLPLTSYFLARDYGCDVENIDKAGDAVFLARKLFATLEVGHRLRFRCCDVFELTELERYDVIFLAALVGADQDEKDRILKHLHRHMVDGALCVVRSAYGLRKLLYPEVPEGLLVRNGFRPVVLVLPLNDVVNSVLIGECVHETTVAAS